MPRRLRLPPQLLDPIQHLDGFLGQVIAAEPSRGAGGGHLADGGNVYSVVHRVPPLPKGMQVV